MRRKSTAMFTAVLLVLSGIAFTDVSAQSGKAPELTTVKIGLPSNGVAGWLGKHVIDGGYDKKFGLKIEPLWMTVTEVERLMSIGQIMVGQVALESTVRARVHGVPVRMLAPLAAPHWRVVVRKDSPYQKLEDMKGKRVGSMRQVTSTFNNFDYITRKRGNGGAEQFFQVTFGEPAAIVTWLEKDDVEAGVIIEPTVSRLLATGKYRVLVNIDEELQKYMGAQYVGIWLGANDEWIKKNPETAKRLVQAFLASNADARKDKAFFMETGQSLFGLTALDVKELAWTRVSPYAVSPATWPDRKMFAAQQAYLDSLIEIGTLPKTAKAQFTDLFWTP